MKLIDGDALKRKLYRLAYDSWKQRYMTTWETAHKEFADMIDDMPTIEPERKMGKWKQGVAKDLIGYNAKIYTCTTCECMEFVPTKFCPNCGADMRGEQDNIPMEYFESGGRE